MTRCADREQQRLSPFRQPQQTQLGVDNSNPFSFKFQRDETQMSSNRKRQQQIINLALASADPARRDYGTPAANTEPLSLHTTLAYFGIH